MKKDQLREPKRCIVKFDRIVISIYEKISHTDKGEIIHYYFDCEFFCLNHVPVNADSFEHAKKLALVKVLGFVDSELQNYSTARERINKLLGFTK